MKYKDYLKSKHWKDLKKHLSKIKIKCCYVCGSKNLLCLHHKHYRTLGKEKGDELVWLCKSHHHEVHFDNGVFCSPINKKLSLRLSDRLESIKNVWKRKNTKDIEKQIKVSAILLERTTNKELYRHRCMMNNYFNIEKIKRLGLKIPPNLVKEYTK